MAKSKKKVPPAVPPTKPDNAATSKKIRPPPSVHDASRSPARSPLVSVKFPPPPPSTADEPVGQRPSPLGETQTLPTFQRDKGPNRRPPTRGSVRGATPVAGTDEVFFGLRQTPSSTPEPPQTSNIKRQKSNKVQRFELQELHLQTMARERQNYIQMALEDWKEDHPDEDHVASKTWQYELKMAEQEFDDEVAAKIREAQQAELSKIPVDDDDDVAGGGDAPPKPASRPSRGGSIKEKMAALAAAQAVDAQPVTLEKEGYAINYGNQGISVKDTLKYTNDDGEDDSAGALGPTDDGDGNPFGPADDEQGGDAGGDANPFGPADDEEGSDDGDANPFGPPDGDQGDDDDDANPFGAASPEPEPGNPFGTASPESNNPFGPGASDEDEGEDDDDSANPFAAAAEEGGNPFGDDDGDAESDGYSDSDSEDELQLKDLIGGVDGLVGQSNHQAELDGMLNGVIF